MAKPKEKPKRIKLSDKDAEDIKKNFDDVNGIKSTISHLSMLLGSRERASWENVYNKFPELKAYNLRLNHITNELVIVDKIDKYDR